MIVKDFKETLTKASKITEKMAALFSEESKMFEDGGDPAEQIYLCAHTLGQLNACFALSMDGYAKVYGIKDLNSEMFKQWVDEISKEVIDQNKGKITEEFKNISEEMKDDEKK